MSKNTFAEAAAELRKMADKMDHLGTVPAPVEVYADIGAAARALRRLEIQGCSIELSFWVSGISAENAVDWRVWDGKDNHKGRTLDQAVKACIAAHTKQPSDTEAEVAKALAPPAERIADLAEKIESGAPLDDDPAVSYAKATIKNLQQPSVDPATGTEPPW